MAWRCGWLWLLVSSVALHTGCAHMPAFGRKGTPTEVTCTSPPTPSTPTDKRPDIALPTVQATETAAQAPGAKEPASGTEHGSSRTDDSTTATASDRVPSPPIRPSAPDPQFAPPQDVPTATAPRPEKVRPPVVEALQCMLEDRHPEALRHLQVYDQRTQECLLQLLPTLSLFARKRMEEVTSQEIAVLDETLYNLRATLRPRTQLAIDHLCFCSAIKAYGLYKPLAPDHAFTAGDLVQLYVELRNFASQEHNGVFETKLSSSVEIRDARGNLLRSFAFDDNKQPLKSLTRLNDYFSNYSFYVPAELDPGSYQLTIQIVDETLPDMRRVARKSLDFRVSGAPAR